MPLATHGEHFISLYIKVRRNINILVPHAPGVVNAVIGEERAAVDFIPSRRHLKKKLREAFQRKLTINGAAGDFIENFSAFIN